MKNAYAKYILSIVDPPPPLCLPRRHDVIHMDQAFPLHFAYCILQVIKNWTVGRTRNGVTVSYVCTGACV